MIANEEKRILDLILKDQTFEQGFNLLIKTYQEKLYWHIRRIVHRHDQTDDVLQNSFIKIFKGIKGFKQQSSLYTWLYRIATNEALSHLKKQKELLNFDDPSLYLESAMKADQYFDGQKAETILKKAIETLPERQKLVFNLRYYDEMSYIDISEVLDTSVGALKASFHHAMKKVEKFLVDNYNYSNG